jgi:hypothetical protein
MWGGVLHGSHFPVWCRQVRARHNTKREECLENVHMILILLANHNDAKIGDVNSDVNEET